jgi:hypothetical protein
MIPHNITREYILKAIQYIEKNGVPENRASRKYALLYQGKQYPPKYVISLANLFANGELLSSSVFNGGAETNNYLRERGFQIIRKSTTKPSEPKINKKTKNLPQIKYHNERCPECKVIVEKMLHRLYGNVVTNYSFDTGVYPEDYISSPYFPILTNIYQSLQRHRGHENFIRTSKLPNVDYYVPNPGFIVEFDESQHFTECRKLSLQQYPQNMKLGFNRNRWLDLCEKIHKADNDPPYRDEQRAWYDTLRDFLPTTKKLLPTIRLYSEAFQWCSLNPDRPCDLKHFQYLLENNSTPWRIEIRQDPNPALARIVIAGDWDGNLETSKQMLNLVFNNWPTGKRVQFITTCGAFLTFALPASIPYIRDNKFPDKSVLDYLISCAEQSCRKLMDDNLCKKLFRCANYITIGVDSWKSKVSVTSAQIRKPHIEMVALLDLQTGNYHWTGKSYPTPGQERGLVRFQDLSSHFISLSIGNLMVLGCHDLNIFSPRGEAVTRNPWRKKVRDDFYKLAKMERPTIVLHHPHTTDTLKIWTPAWNKLTRTLPSVERYLGSGRYYNNGDEQRSNITDVLNKTKMGDTLDFIIWK